MKDEEIKRDLDILINFSRRYNEMLDLIEDIT